MIQHFQDGVLSIFVFFVLGLPARKEELLVPFVDANPPDVFSSLDMGQIVCIVLLADIAVSLCLVVTKFVRSRNKKITFLLTHHCWNFNFCI